MAGAVAPLRDIRRGPLSAPAVADADHSLPVPASPHDWLAERRFALDEGLRRLAAAARAGAVADGSIEDSVLRVERTETAVPDGPADLVADLYRRLPEARITDILLEVDDATPHGVPVDDDLGRSGGGARPRFERPLLAICEGRVGIVLAVEASRLARNGRAFRRRCVGRSGPRWTRRPTCGTVPRRSHEDALRAPRAAVRPVHRDPRRRADARQRRQPAGVPRPAGRQLDGTDADPDPQGLQRPGSVAHGFRSTSRDWAVEETDHPREVIEAALGPRRRQQARGRPAAPAAGGMIAPSDRFVPAQPGGGCVWTARRAPGP